jgi:hypothetical protein
MLKIDTWVLARDANGSPDMVPVLIECSEQDVADGNHYERAMARCEELGYEPMGAFDERDPAGRKMVSLMNFEGWKKQDRVPGDASRPVWSVPLTLDMTLSATVLAHGKNKNDALLAAREFAASGEGYGLFSLDDGNYRGPRDFYCPDQEGIEEVYDDELSELVQKDLVISVQASPQGATDSSPPPPDVVRPQSPPGNELQMSELEKHILASHDIHRGSPLSSGHYPAARVPEEGSGQSPSGVTKTVIEVTVLHPDGQPIDGLSLAQIGNEIDEGDFLGSYSITQAVPVAKSALHDEQIALGNDGRFFDHLDDGEDDDADAAQAATHPDGARSNSAEHATGA